MKKSKRGRFSIIDEVATRILILVLLSTSLTYGQSFFDSSIAGGITKEQTPIGGTELRFNYEVVKEFYISPSANFMLSFDKTGNVDMNLFPRIGLTDRMGNGTNATIGLTLQENATTMYGRIDQRVLTTDRGDINIIIDIQNNKGMIGISFNNKGYERL